MRELKPADEVVALLGRLDRSGGVVQHVLASGDQDLSGEDQHRSAVGVAMETLDRALSERAERLASSITSSEEFFRFLWDTSRMTGRRISFAEFLGTTGNGVGSDPRKLGELPKVDGYMTAMLYPPYPLQGTWSELLDLCEELKRHLFGDAPDHAEVYAWSTNWSNFFDAGKEWWGAFFWTVRPTDRDWIVCVGASASD